MSPLQTTASVRILSSVSISLNPSVNTSLQRVDDVIHSCIASNGNLGIGYSVLPEHLGSRAVQQHAAALETACDRFAALPCLHNTVFIAVLQRRQLSPDI